MVLFGASREARRKAQKVADKINAEITQGTYVVRPKAKPVPSPRPRVLFSHFAEMWLRQEVEAPTERGERGSLAPGTVQSVLMAAAAETGVAGTVEPSMAVWSPPDYFKV